MTGGPGKFMIVTSLAFCKNKHYIRLQVPGPIVFIV